MFTDRLLKNLKPFESKRLVVGFSGGVDSHVLLFCLARGNPDVNFCALHINHGLSPQSDDWEAHCSEVARQLGVPFYTQRVHVQTHGSLEASARRARYGAFESFLEEQDVLLLAHHQDDQVETILMNLFRGSSQFGVVGMPARRALGKAMLFRPLLDSTREEINQYASANSLEFIQDESNAEQAHDRNYLRHRILPMVRARWEQVPMSLIDAAQRDAAYTQLIENIGENDLLALSSGDGGVSLPGLALLSVPRQKNIVRCWLRSHGLPLPSEGILDQLDQMRSAAQDTAPLLAWQGVTLRRFRNRLYLTGELPELSPTTDLSLQDLQENGIKIETRIVKGHGLREDAYMRARLRLRSGGERIRVRENRTLKNVLQDAGVPPWLRGALPLVFLEDELIATPAIPGWQVPMVIAERYEATAATTGVEIVVNFPNQPYSH